MSDYAVVKGEATLQVFDNLADAVGLWRTERRAGARILNLAGDGRIYAAVVGDLRVRDRGRPTGRKSWVGPLPIGWTRLVPPQRSEFSFGLSGSEKHSLAPGKTIVGRRTDAQRRSLAARRRRANVCLTNFMSYDLVSMYPHALSPVRP